MSNKKCTKQSLNQNEIKLGVYIDRQQRVDMDMCMII